MRSKGSPKIDAEFAEIYQNTLDLYALMKSGVTVTRSELSVGQEKALIVLQREVSAFENEPRDAK